jgi:arylsulfatase
MYFSPGANHAPHHSPKEWADKYKGVFDDGYEKIRVTILANQKRLGIVPEGTKLPPINPLAGLKSVEGKEQSEFDLVRPWESLSEDEKRLMIRMAEVYAGFSSYTDHELGRLIDYLEQIGELDNTLIVWISDNGASGEGGPNGSVNENKFFNGVMDDMEENLKYLDVLGSPETYNHYSTGRAFAFNTPCKLFKRHTWEGRVADPMVVSWPRGMAARGDSRDQYCHSSDIVPTVYECLDIEPPGMVKGFTQWPLEGTSFRYSFDDAGARTRKESQFYVMLGTRAIWRNGWKAEALHAGAPSGWSHFAEDRWALYHVDEDRAELHDLADEQPELLENLKALWHVQAGRFSGLPLDDRTAIEVLTTPRPQISSPRDRYVYYPNTLEVPEAVAVNIRGRSFKIAAQIDLTSPGPAGVIFAHGHSFGGHALYLKDRKLKYVYNYLGELEQMLVSDIDVSKGPCILGVEVAKQAQTPAATTGQLTLFIDDRQVGELGDVKIQNGKFALCGEGLNIGRDGGAPVTLDYPFDRPPALRGATIKRVIVDVSGEPYLDLEKESLAMMSRD